MAAVATLHVRNVPEDLYARLRGRAGDAGRSINAQAIETLRRALGEQESISVGSYLQRARARRERARSDVGAAELIREDRER